jgi:hypothetical protein
MNGSTNTATELFTITNGAGTPVTTFSVDSSSGNSYIAGTLQVGTLASGTKFDIDANGNVVIRGNLTVTGVTTSVSNETVNNNETITGTMSVNSTADIDAAATFTGSISGTTLTVSSSVAGGTISIGDYLYGNNVTAGTVVTAGSGTSWTVAPSQTIAGGTVMTAGGPAATIAGGLTVAKQIRVGGVATINGNTSVTGSSTFNVGTGKTTLGGDFDAAGVISFSNTASGINTGTGALNVTGSTVLNNHLTVIGGSGKNFKITNGGATPVTTFNIDTNTGDTVLVSTGTLTLGKIAANAGGGSPYTGTISGGWALTGVTSYINTTAGTLYSTTLNTNGGTGTVTGAWTFSDATVVDNALTLKGSTTPSAQPFIINDGNPAGAVTKFQVDSANGNTTIQGSLSVGTTSTFTGRVTATVQGSIYATDGSTLLVDAASKIITANLNMATASTGQLPVTYGGTGAGSASGGLNNLLNSIASSASAGMVLTYNGASNYTWAYPLNITAPNLGTKITTTSFSYTVGSSTGADGVAIVNGATVITTPPYGTGQLKVFIDGVRQDGAFDYAETTGKDGDNNWGKITFSGGGVATGEQLLLEVDGYVAYDVNAVSVIFTPNGTVTATNVQTAIQQIDTAKMPLVGGNFTGSVTMVGATTINLGAGTASVAPLKFSAGTNLSSPSAGAIEFNGTNMFYTDTANTRRTFASTSYVDTAVTNGTASAVPWTGITGKPTTISGFGITDAITTGNIGSQSVSYATTAGSATSATTATSATSATSATTATTAGTANALNTANAYTVKGLTSTAGVGITGNLDVSVNAGIQGFLSANSIESKSFITAVGDITAFYSDRRLKTNVATIPNALTKVMSLNGILYTPNALAESFGFKAGENIVGLFADEVEAVLPQAVKPAPFDTDADGISKSGENYKTIQYEKVVPLLVEAIKEQQATIERQQAQIDMLISKLGA